MHHEHSGTTGLWPVVWHWTKKWYGGSYDLTSWFLTKSSDTFCICASIFHTHRTEIHLCSISVSLTPTTIYLFFASNVLNISLHKFHLSITRKKFAFC